MHSEAMGEWDHRKEDSIRCKKASRGWDWGTPHRLTALLFFSPLPYGSHHVSLPHFKEVFFAPQGTAGASALHTVSYAPPFASSMRTPALVKRGANRRVAGRRCIAEDGTIAKKIRSEDARSVLCTAGDRRCIRALFFASSPHVSLRCIFEVKRWGGVLHPRMGPPQVHCEGWDQRSGGEKRTGSKGDWAFDACGWGFSSIRFN